MRLLHRMATSGFAPQAPQAFWFWLLCSSPPRVLVFRRGLSYHLPTVGERPQREVAKERHRGRWGNALCLEEGAGPTKLQLKKAWRLGPFGEHSFGSSNQLVYSKMQ